MSATSLLEIEYPTSDGKPMAETDLHRKLMVESIETLDGHFADRDNVYVSGNMLVYYEKGNAQKHQAPDVFVVFDVPKMEREIFLIWEEGKAPDVIFEITSKTTKREDLEDKRILYRDIWKVKEYFLFDPREEYLNPSLQGYRLVEGEFQRIEPSFGQLFSEVLGLKMERQGIHLVFRDPKTGRQLMRPDQERARQADLARELAEVKAGFAESEAKEALEAKEREKHLREQIEMELKLAHEEKEREKILREQADAEIKRLRDELEAARQQQPPAK